MDGFRPSEYHQPKQELASDEIIDQLNIRYRVCHLFTENIEKKQDNVPENEKICKCGLEKRKHKRSLEDLVTYWTMPHNTLEKIDPAHGQLPNKKSCFVQLALDTPLEKVEKILLEAWKIPKPRFIVSIIGGAKYFKLSDRLETIFINGIVDIAQKSDAWLLTNGYNTGIIQLVGQAINKVRLTKQKQTITAIGICKRGCIANFPHETGSKKEKTKEKTTDAPTYEKKRRRSGEWELEMNHTHYLMLDDGTIRDYDTENYRTRLAIHMARLQHENDVNVPVVTIVVEGGKDTIANVYYDLRENVPVVLVVGSGRAADFLNRWLLYTRDIENETENPEIVCEINELEVYRGTSGSNKNQDNKRGSGSGATNSTSFHLDYNNMKLEKMFKNYKENLVEDLKTTINMGDKPDKSGKTVHDIAREVMYCLQPAVRSDITIFNLNSDSDLSETIFRSICRSRQKLSKRKEIEQNDLAERKQQRLEALYNKERKKIESQARSMISQKEQNAERSRLLELAMDWDCIDVAREYIFKSSLDNILNKNKAFETALKRNRPTFVYEFLKLEINLYEIFFPKSEQTQIEYQYKKFITILYTDDAVNSDKTHLKYFIEIDRAETKRKINSVEELNIILNALIGDYMHKLYFDTLEEEDDDRIKNGLIQKRRSLSDEDRKEIIKDYFMRDLFIWAILMNYTDMAKVFLSHMKYRICPALIATKILKQYHQKATYRESKESYMKSAKYFEKYAIDCLDKCDDHDADQACEIILQRNELYGYVTCLQVAAHAKDKLFIATPCCVHALNNIWYDKLHPEQSRLSDKASLLAGFVSLGLVAPVFVSYRKTKKEIKKINPSVRKLRSNGINYSDPSLLEYFARPPSSPEYKRYFPKLKKFHQSLPMKFCYRFITYCFFLLLFSYFLLFNFEPPTNKIPSIHWTEILTIILISCMLIEEVHYFFSQDNLLWGGRFANYFTQLFKIFSVSGFILFYIGLILRFTHASSEDEFTVARIIMAIDLELWWLRFLSFIIVTRFLGPHLVAIAQMLKDLAFFMCIIAIVMAGYGVASRAMVYYPKANGFTTNTGGPIDTSFDGRSVFRQIAYPVYYMMYGEFGTELGNLNTNPNAAWSIATHVLLAIHMIFVNILLINLLIAMFSKRFEQVYDDTQNIWHSQQYTFIREYYTRSPFFPPISLFYDIYYLFRMLIFFIRRKFFHKSADYRTKVFQIIPKKDSTIKEWCIFEETSTYEHAHNEVKALKTASAKSTSGVDSNNKENNEAMADNKNDQNTVDGLKQVEDDLTKLTLIIEEMRGKLQKNKEKEKEKKTS